MAEGLGKQPQPFTGRKSSLNSSQGARQPLEERVGSVLKVADNPSSGSFTASVKVPTGLQLTVQPTGKTDRNSAALSLLTIVFIIILIIKLNLMHASLTSIRLLRIRESQARKAVLCPFWDTGHEDIRPISVVDVLNLDLPHSSKVSGTEVRAKLRWV